jgi:hypothetical protein
MNNSDADFGHIGNPLTNESEECSSSFANSGLPFLVLENMLQNI